MLVEFHNVTDLTFPVRLSAVFCDPDLRPAFTQISKKHKGEMGGRVWLGDPMTFYPSQVPCRIASGASESHRTHRTAPAPGR